MKKMFTNFNNQVRMVHETIVEFVSTKKGKKADETVKYYEQRLDEFNKYLEAEENIMEVLDITRSVRRSLYEL